MSARRGRILGRLRALAGAGLALALAAADRSPLEDAFSSTLVSTYPDGRKAELWLDRGGGYTARGRRGDPSSGHWRISGDELCLKQSSPFPAPFAYCTPIPPHGLQSPWTAKAVTGEPITVGLVRGRHAPARPPAGSDDAGRPASASP